MKVIEGMLSSKGLKMAIVAARFNEFITAKMPSVVQKAIWTM